MYPYAKKRPIPPGLYNPHRLKEKPVPPRRFLTSTSSQSIPSTSTQSMPSTSTQSMPSTSTQNVQLSRPTAATQIDTLNISSSPQIVDTVNPTVQHDDATTSTSMVLNEQPNAAPIDDEFDDYNVPFNDESDDIEPIQNSSYSLPTNTMHASSSSQLVPMSQANQRVVFRNITNASFLRPDQNMPPNFSPPIQNVTPNMLLAGLQLLQRYVVNTSSSSRNPSDSAIVPLDYFSLNADINGNDVRNRITETTFFYLNINSISNYRKTNPKQTQQWLKIVKKMTKLNFLHRWTNAFSTNQPKANTTHYAESFHSLLL